MTRIIGNGVSYKWVCGVVIGLLVCVGAWNAKTAIADIRVMQDQAVDFRVELVQLKASFTGLETALGKVESQLIELRKALPKAMP